MTLTGARDTPLVGREPERAVLLEVLDEGGPLLTFVHGAAGMGKSALLRSFAADAEEAGTRLVWLDCRTFEPTARGFLDALGRGLGLAPGDDVLAAARSSSGSEPVVLIIDTYEVFRISDSWLRSTLVPALGSAVRVVVGGREPPLTSWLDARGTPQVFRSIHLGPLAREDSIRLLEAAGVTAEDARAVDRVARGHPLALQVAVAALRERPRLRVQDTAIPRVVEELTRLYLDGLPPATRDVLGAASVVRRVTEPLLAAMLPEVPVHEAVLELAALPFVEETADGLRLHESVQAAVAARVRSRDPVRYRSHRAAAWRSLRRETDQATRSELWRYTADLLYLLENPAVREAFFPTTDHLYAVEPARPQDEIAVQDIIERHEPSESAAVLRVWWRERPATFRIVRDRSDAVAGFTVLVEATDVPQSLVRSDPILTAWRDHQQRHPLPRGQRALYQRISLDREHGEAPCPVQATIWLDVKRVYMELRPHLGRLYSVVVDPEPYEEALTTLGFAYGPGQVNLGVAYHSVHLDFGPDSVDGWLARLAAEEIGVRPEEPLDQESRELRLDGRRIQLSPLEFGVLNSLMARRGGVVSRSALIEEVWGQAGSGGSNVVDVVVRSIRKKLGKDAERLEAVRGVGYRWRDNGLAPGGVRSDPTTDR